MFVLSDALPKIWWPVTVKWPSDTKPGETVEMNFRVLFEALAPEEARAIDEALTKAEIAGDASQRNALMQRVVKDWGDVVEPDEKKTPIPFSTDALTAALRFSWVRIGLNKAWTAFVAADHRLGN